jgi:hypothetical protein
MAYYTVHPGLEFVLNLLSTSELLVCFPALTCVLVFDVVTHVYCNTHLGFWVCRLFEHVYVRTYVRTYSVRMYEYVRTRSTYVRTYVLAILEYLIITS